MFCLLLETRRPGEPDEKGHDECREKSVAGMVGEADGEEAKGQRMSHAPVPEVLVQGEDQKNERGQQESLENHGKSAKAFSITHCRRGKGNLWRFRVVIPLMIRGLLP